MSPLRPASLDRVRRVWAELAGARNFPPTGAHVITNAASKLCPPGWHGVVAIGDGVLAIAPTDVDGARFRNLIDAVGPHGDWSGAFADAIERRGPAELAYLDKAANPMPHDDAIEYVAADDERVVALLNRVPADERDQAGIAACRSPVASIRCDDLVVAAAGYRVWLDEIAHMSVLVDARYRGRRLGTAVAAAATKHAVAQGLLAQWRAQPLASRVVAHHLGYVPVGQQMSLRFA